MQEIYKNYTITIESDDDAESPDSWDDEDIFLVYDHRQFAVSRTGFEPRDIWECICDIKEKEYEGYYVFTVYAYIHSGVSLSLGYNGDMWDTSSTGFILVKKDLLKGSSKNEEDLTKEEAEKYAENLIKNWNKYLSEEVYWYKIEKIIEQYLITKEDLDDITSDNGFIQRAELISESEKYESYEEIDSCGNNYDDEEAVLEKCKLIIDNILNNE
jgi:hypothetical protein